MNKELQNITPYLPVQTRHNQTNSCQSAQFCEVPKSLDSSFFFIITPLPAVKKSLSRTQVYLRSQFISRKPLSQKSCSPFQIECEIINSCKSGPKDHQINRQLDRHSGPRLKSKIYVFLTTRKKGTFKMQNSPIIVMSIENLCVDTIKFEIVPKSVKTFSGQSSLAARALEFLPNQKPYYPGTCSNA